MCSGVLLGHEKGKAAACDKVGLESVGVGEVREADGDLAPTRGEVTNWTTVCYWRAGGGGKYRVAGGAQTSGAEHNVGRVAQFTYTRRHTMFALLTPTPFERKRALPQPLPAAALPPPPVPDPRGNSDTLPVAGAACPRPRPPLHVLCRSLLLGRVPSVTAPPSPPARVCSPAAPCGLPTPPWATQVQRVRPCLPTAHPSPGLSMGAACRPVRKVPPGGRVSGGVRPLPVSTATIHLLTPPSSWQLPRPPPYTAPGGFSFHFFSF